MDDLSMIILAGGASRRMGRDKASLVIDGKTFLDIQMEKGRSLGISDIIVSGRFPEGPGYRVVEDNVSGRGPLEGLRCCLSAALNDRALVLAVDTPLVPTDELKRLIRFSEKDSTVPTVLSHGGEIEPLIGVYPKSVIPYAVEELENGKGAMRSVLKAKGYLEYRSSLDESFFVNINTPEAYSVLGGCEIIS